VNGDIDDPLAGGETHGARWHDWASLGGWPSPPTDWYTQPSYRPHRAPPSKGRRSTVL